MIIFLESEFEKILNNCKIPNCGIALDNNFAIGTEQINAMVTRFQGSISPDMLCHLSITKQTLI